MGFVYKLTLKKKSRKAYIGQTLRDIEDRLKEHQQLSSGCRAISAAIQKHGWENFEKEWYEVPDEDLNFYEEMLVALLGTLAPGGYNLKEGGGATGKMSEESKKKMSEALSGEKHPMYGKEHTEKAKQKMREANSGEKHPMYGKTLSGEIKKKLSEALSGEKHPMYGKTPSDKTKQKMSDARTGEKHHMYGKTHTKETKKKISKAMTGEKHHASKRVYQYTLDGTYVDDFASGEEAAQTLGKTDGSSIRKCVRDKLKSAYGFKWYSEKL